MLDIQILTKERMSESGSSLLKLMQSQSINTLDLLVRESIQNSLDASKNRKSKTRVDVEFITGKFPSGPLCDEFPYISERLKKRFPLKEYDFIAVRDLGTTGLTGTNNNDDDKSHLQKLIYQISKNREEEGSGGNWGLGKTTFFRFGIGLVIFYSRTFENDKYCYKLAASLVEDETKNPLITVDNNRGISFFGKYENKNPKNIRDVTVPIEDENEIQRLLDIFSIDKYKGTETGTTVIMPFVDYNKHLKEIQPENLGPGERSPLWTDNIESSLRILIQRWYAPRISNPEYSGSWLKPSVNGKPINRSNMEPFFLLIQDLYNYSTDQNYKFESIEDINSVLVKTSPIKCRSIIGNIGGYIASAYVELSILGLTSEKNRNAYALIGDYSVSPGEPIVTYTRKPGMLIKYETKNSPWIPKNSNLEDDKILICIFRLDSDKQISDNNGHTTLEEYVRSCEKSDHYEWADMPKNSIISRLSENTSKKLQELYGEKNNIDTVKRSRLCDIFTDTFLPTFNNPVPTVDAPKTTRTKKTSHKKTSKRCKTSFYSEMTEDNSRSIKIRIGVPSAERESHLKIIIVSENTSKDGNEWEKEMDSPFPIDIISMKIQGMTFTNCVNRTRNDIIDLSKKSNRLDVYSVELEKTTKYNIISGIHIITDKPGATIELEIQMKSCIDGVSVEIKTSSGGI